MIIDGLEILPTTPTSGDELPIEREDKAYKIDYDALAAAILRLCVTGIKGNAESSYRLGKVNITPTNIGAKETQAAVSDPSASGTSITFIATIVQNSQGVITPTKKTVSSATQSSAGLMSANDKAKLDGITEGAQPNVITGVKGNAESSYRKGNVNLTPANIGAMPDSTPIPSKTSDLTNDSGFISQETDPTVPSWAKAETKPSYTASEVGALPDNTRIPSKTSDLTNDSGFITQHQDISGKADKVSGGTSGNFAALDANGNIADSGHKHTDYLTAHQDISGKKNTQSPVSDPSASGDSLEFIAGITQNSQGVITPNKKTVSKMVGATNSSEGRAGLVPVPPSNGYNSKFLRADGTWETPAGISVSGVKGDAEADYRHGDINLTPANIGAKPTQTAVSDPTASGEATAFIAGITQDANGVITPTKKTVRSASQSESGLMSATDKAKLDGIAAGAQVTSVNGITGAVSITPANIGAYSKSETDAAIAQSAAIYSAGIGSVDNIVNTNPTVTTMDALVQYVFDTYFLPKNKQLEYVTTWAVTGASDSRCVGANADLGTIYQNLTGFRPSYGYLTFERTPHGNQITVTYIPFANGNTAPASKCPQIYAHYSNSANAWASGTKMNNASGWYMKATTRVKGNAESSYRFGDVNITPANIGLGSSALDFKVADANISSGTQMFALTGTVQASGAPQKGHTVSFLVRNSHLTLYDHTDSKNLWDIFPIRVKGNAEGNYRTGDIILTPANIGAYSKSETDAAIAQSMTWTKAGEATGTNPVSIPATAKEILVYGSFGGNAYYGFTWHAIRAHNAAPDRLMAGNYTSASGHHAAYIILNFNNNTVALGEWIYDATNYVSTSKIYVYYR